MYLDVLLKDKRSVNSSGDSTHSNFQNLQTLSCNFFKDLAAFFGGLEPFYVYILLKTKKHTLVLDVHLKYLSSVPRHCNHKISIRIRTRCTFEILIQGII